MATSRVEIWNLALGHIRASNSVQSPTEQSPEAEQCRLFYPLSVQTVLRAYDWQFAKVRQTLALTGTPPDDQWLYQYIYPSDALKVRRIFNPVDPQNELYPPVKYEIAANPDSAGKVIWTDQIEAVLIYTKDVTDTTLFDPQFDMALSYYLASRLAIPITGDRQKADDMIRYYQFELSSALASDANENFSDQDVDAEWIRARH